MLAEHPVSAVVTSSATVCSWLCSTATQVDHSRSHLWLEGGIEDGWASCAITEIGFVRIFSEPRYPSPVSPVEGIDRLSRGYGYGPHEFWTCDVSLADRGVGGGQGGVAKDRRSIVQPTEGG